MNCLTPNVKVEFSNELNKLEKTLLELEVNSLHLDDLKCYYLDEAFKDKYPQNSLTNDERVIIGYANLMEHYDMIHYFRTGRSWIIDNLVKEKVISGIESELNELEGGRWLNNV